MRSVLICIFMAATLPALAQPKPSEKQLRSDFSGELKDAESAKFRSVKSESNDVDGLWRVCGEVNAKNSYGGYTGFEPFFAMASKKSDGSYKYLLFDVGDYAGTQCKKYGLR